MIVLCDYVCVWGKLRSGVFLFQAEDGIRYLVRSRGLGDVYKRQMWRMTKSRRQANPQLFMASNLDKAARGSMHFPKAVSYTHLTLPTSDLV